MRKNVLYVSLSLLLMFLAVTEGVVEAETEQPMLNEAKIDIQAESESHYTVKETITLSLADLSTIENTITRLSKAEIENLTITSNGQTLKSSRKEDGVITRHFIEPPSTDESLTYVVEYRVKTEGNSHQVPLLVPMYPTSGKENAVSIQFTSPEGTHIYKDSFPVVLQNTGNEVTSHLLNVPSHVNYKFGHDRTNPLNVHNVISGLVLLILAAIIVIWFLAERRNMKGES